MHQKYTTLVATIKTKVISKEIITKMNENMNIKINNVITKITRSQSN